MMDWANHSPRTGEESDRLFRHFTMIMAAFRFGFLSHVIRAPQDYWNPDALRFILIAFASELTSPGFDVLKSAVTELEDQASTLFKSPKASDLLDSFGALWSWDSPPANRKLHSLANKLLRWIDDAARFGDSARNAVLEASPYRRWFDCGRWLGDCVKQSPRGNRREESALGALQLSIHYLQEAVGRLPPDFLEVFYWLKSYSDFDFRTGSPGEWFKQVPLADGIAVGESDAIADDSASALRPYGADGGEDVMDFESLFDYFYTRFNRDLGFVHFLMVSGRLDLVSGKPTPIDTRTPFVPSQLQAKILQVLVNQAMTKKMLANAVCAGEGSRLYRKNGIKELMQLGLVMNRHGTGYYRPDAPPPGAIKLS